MAKDKDFPELMERANKIGQTTGEKLVLGVTMMKAFQESGSEGAERILLIAVATAKQHKIANRL